MFLPINFIIVAGRARHVRPDLAQYLVSILNTGSTFGRIIPPFLADKYGRFAVYIISIAVSSIMILALWLPGSGTAATVVFALIFGFTSGAVASILPALVATISPISQIGVRTGCCFAIVSIAVLIGSPIAGQLIENDGLKSMQGFAGAMMGGGFILCSLVWTRLGGLKGKKI
jgi:MFS family permease